MSNKSGATKAQIEEATNREMVWRTEMRDVPFLYSRQVAPFLVGETKRIIEVEDLRKLKMLHDELAEMTMLAPSMDAVAFLERMDRVIAGDGE